MMSWYVECDTNGRVLQIMHNGVMCGSKGQSLRVALSAGGSGGAKYFSSEYGVRSTL
jgi:hypothetical protein